jgi:crossover junction endodeoxyribonuclease RuvC
MLILGVDPGLNTTGFGLVRQTGRQYEIVEGGCVSPQPRHSLAQRLLELESGLKPILDEYSPQVMVLEELYSHYRHPRTSILMGHARGVICLLAARHGIPVVPLVASHVKLLLTGNGRASKRQVQHMVAHYLGLRTPLKPLDISDALALALAFALERIEKTAAE